MKTLGSALIYLLVAIALLGALTMSFVEPNGQQSRAQNAYKIATQLRDQAETYRAAVQDCVITYPAGDTSNITKYTGYNEPYPLSPSADYLDDAVEKADDRASGIMCPGNPGTSTAHTALFGGSTGRFAPVKPALMDDWTYTNDADGVYVLIRTNKTDLYLQDGMQKADAMYDTCESDYIVGNTAPCATNYYCLRVWVSRNTACP